MGMVRAAHAVLRLERILHLAPSHGERTCAPILRCNPKYLEQKLRPLLAPTAFHPTPSDECPRLWACSDPATPWGWGLAQVRCRADLWGEALACSPGAFSESVDDPHMVSWKVAMWSAEDNTSSFTVLESIARIKYTKRKSVSSLLWMECHWLIKKVSSLSGFLKT